MARIDERNVMFSRMSRIEGTKEYDDYYKAHPENKEFDDALRAMPALNGDKTKFYNQLDSPIVDATFGFLADIKGLVDGGEKAAEKVQATPETFTRKLKGLAEFYGAKLTGVAELDESYYYTYRGRTDQVYGEKVEAHLPYTFVFAVEMDPAYINTAPVLSQSIGVVKGYLDAAIVGMMITYYIKSLGYEARNHMDGNYLMVMPLAAKAAGLGDIGRHALLITPEFGSRIRLGAVSTDMPLLKSQPSLLKVRDFCEACGRCAKLCPSKAISKELPRTIDGVERWQTAQELCYKKWMEFGTDCGICIASCPFSLPMEKSDIEKYYKDPGYVNEILKKYNITDFRQKMDEDKLKWLK
ncbi:MAG: reductive dehalogenase domain-containing protein [Gudongella sp.]|nr:reductive dehalogenase domain-containing protein [Gudongella sp.]